MGTNMPMIPMKADIVPAMISSPFFNFFDIYPVFFILNDNKKRNGSFYPEISGFSWLRGVPLLHGDALGQVPREIYGAAALFGRIVGE
jgi:hypothetical protein